MALGYRRPGLYMQWITHGLVLVTARIENQFTGIGWLAGTGTAVTLFFGLPSITRSE